MSPSRWRSRCSRRPKRWTPPLFGKAEALEKKGFAATFSSGFKLLKKEMQAASAQLRAERLAAERSGRRGAYCPPKSIALDSKELLAHLRAIPAAQRPRVQVKDALRSFLLRKFPCAS